MTEVKRYTFHRELYTGWHPESLDEGRTLDDVIDGGVASMVLASDYDTLQELVREKDARIATLEQAVDQGDARLVRKMIKNARLKTQLRLAEQEVAEARKGVAFFASVARGKEDWSPTCDAIYDTAMGEAPVQEGDKHE